MSDNTKRPREEIDVSVKRVKAVGKRTGRKTRSARGVGRGDTVTYNGPIILPKSMEQAEVFPMNFSVTGLVNADGGGVISQVFQTEDVRNAGDWSNVSQAYDEYRVVGMKFVYAPIRRFDTAFPYPPIITLVERANNAAITSYSSMATHESVQFKEAFRQFTRTLKMQSVEEADFLYVGDTPTSWGSIKIYGSGYTSSASYARYMITYLVQFRGRA